MSEASLRLAALLKRSLAALEVDVVDESASHAGHAGAAPGGGTHFSVRVVSPRFSGKSRLERHRLVHDAVAGEWAGSLHALSIRAISPEESGS